MSTTALAASTAPPALPGPYARPPSPDGLRPDPATISLVRDQVQALLLGSPSFHRMRPRERRRLAHDLVKVAAYAAECVRDDWYQSSRLGQRPLVVRTQRVAAAPARTAEAPPPAAEEAPAPGPVATAQAEQRPGADFVPGAANRIGQVTRQTLDAIAFPTFVAELIRGTFNAITDASIKQMEAYGRLLGDVGRTVDDFMNQNISDNQARDWLVQQYPQQLRIERAGGRGAAARPGRAPRPSRAGGGRAPEERATLAAVEGADQRPLPNWRADLGVTGTPSLDESWLEEKLLPAARRRLAQTRLQMLSTMVLMGMNRITVTGGKLRATMAFHIDTSDIAREERATDLDFRTAGSASGNFGMWSASASVSFAYVSSTRSAAESEMNVAADLTSEVEIHFRSDPFPLERMAGPAQLGRIVSHTAVPETNTPVGSGGSPIPWGAEVQRATVPQRNRPGWTYRPPGSPLPPAPAPAAPAPVTPAPGQQQPGEQSGGQAPAEQPVAEQPAAEQPATDAGEGG
ncbi:MAG TPA: hypothetical protein VGV57_06325 [Thermoleophilaceae bacterium]|nr:hypothetical protein [Thermoleophilaceae bacterium]